MPECEGDYYEIANGKVHEVCGRDRDLSVVFAPSTNWRQGGPIIEREGVNLSKQTSGIQAWEAWPDYGMSDELAQCGPTPLIAAMRAYAVSKLGDEVDIPEELT